MLSLIRNIMNQACLKESLERDPPGFEHASCCYLHHLNLFSTQAIHGYRETERLQWGVLCESILRRVRVAAFPEGSPLLGPIHVLDLDKEGYIKPHIDSVKVCL